MLGQKRLRFGYIDIYICILALVKLIRCIYNIDTQTYIDSTTNI